MKTRSTLLSCIYLFVLTICFLCRKTDLSSLPPDNKVVEDFFRLPSNVSPEVVKVAQDLEKQNSVINFLPSFIKKNGTPRWDKVFFKVEDNYTATSVGGRQS